MKNSSRYWENLLLLKGEEIVDPDGWDRSRFTESWEEKITAEEFIQRFYNSSVRFMIEGSFYRDAYTKNKIERKL